MNILDINPYIRVARQSIHPPYYPILTRVIFDYELIYVERGSLILTYNGAEYFCRAGDILFFRPGITHGFVGTDEELSQPHIHFDIFQTSDSHRIPVCFRDICDLSPLEKTFISDDVFKNYPQQPFVKFSDTEQFLKLFYPIVNNDLCTPPLVKKALLMQIIDMLIAENFPCAFSQTPDTSYPVVAQLKDYIDAGQGLSMSLDDLAKQFNYSKFYLEKRFKKLYGTGLISYRNNKRLALAYQMLKTDSVSSVAYKTGYSSIYTFSCAFKKRYGIPPSEIKKRGEAPQA